MFSTLILLFLIFFFPFSVKSQDLKAVDQIVRAYEMLSLESMEELAGQINRDFETDLQKARAVYTWIALNIRYDVGAYKYGISRVSYLRYYYTELDKQNIEKTRRKEVAEYTFKHKMGVCDGYANLYQALCDLLGIACQTVHGTTKTLIRDISPGTLYSNHAWNAVKLADKWLLMDTTWGAGSVIDDQFFPVFDDIYFATPPEKFHLNHYPDDPAYLFTDLSKARFLALPLYYTNFLKYDLALEEPNLGIIEIKPGCSIPLKICSRDSLDLMFYKYNNDVFPQDLAMVKVGECYESEIPAPEGNPVKLTVYGMGKALVSYRLEYN